MAQDQLVFEFVLDDKSVDKELGKVEDKADSLDKKLKKALDAGFQAFDKASLSIIAVNQGLELVGKAIAAVQKAFELIGKGADLIKVEEQITKLNKQFDFFADRAVGAGNDLKQAFIDAGQGLTDDEEIIKSANKALVSLSGQAGKLPEIFELATKTAQVFGGTSIQNFEELTQAIQSGRAQSGLIKQLGIDGEAAFEAYAKSIGTTTANLSLQQKQQVLTNELLKQGAENLKGIAVDTNNATASFTKLGVAFGDVGDSLAITFSSLFKPAFKGISDFATDVLINVKNSLDKNFGDPAQQLAARISQLKIAVADAQSQMTEFNKQFNPGVYTSAENSLARFNAELNRLVDLQKVADEDARKASRTIGGIPKNIMDALKADQVPIPSAADVAKKQSEFQNAMLTANQQNLQARIAQAQLIADETLRQQTLDKLTLDQEAVEKENHQLRIKQLEDKFKIDKSLSQTQFNILLEAEETRHQFAVDKIQLDADTRRSEQLKKTGEMVRSTILSGISSTLQGMGQALQKGEDLFSAFGKGVAGIIGDLAINLGNGLIAQGLALEGFITAINSLIPGSGLAAAALGAGLVIFGSALKSSVGAGGGGSGPSGSISGGGGVASDSGGGFAALPAEDELQSTAPGTQINVRVDGNILDRRQTGLELTEVIREAFETQGAVAVQSFA